MGYTYNLAKQAAFSDRMAFALWTHAVPSGYL